MSNNKQQTAVKQFVATFKTIKVQLDNQEISVDEYAVAYVILLYKAKEMEKERMIKFCIDWFISREMNIKEYYEQTYGEGEQ
jgi:hypothetical protein